MFKVPSNFRTFASIFDLTPIEEDFLLHLVWKAPALSGGGLLLSLLYEGEERSEGEPDGWDNNFPDILYF